MDTVVVRLWLPDRPGALGQVASRIGAVRGDVVGIDILERGGGNAIDELVVGLPTGTDVALLISEIAQVDGVAIEEVRSIPGGRPDPGLVALDVAARLVEEPPHSRLELLCTATMELVDGEWAVAFADGAESPPIVSLGTAPEVPWLAAFVEGSRHLTDDARDNGAPGDLAWASLERRGVALAIGRAGRPFHARERQQIALLARIADRLP